MCHIAARAGKKECLELLHKKMGDDISPFLTADKVMRTQCSEI